MVGYSPCIRGVRLNLGCAVRVGFRESIGPGCSIALIIAVTAVIVCGSSRVVLHSGDRSLEVYFLLARIGMGKLPPRIGLLPRRGDPSAPEHELLGARIRIIGTEPWCKRRKQ